MMLYFAYGSNLDEDQMRKRCPFARVEAKGQFNGWRLTFAGHSTGWRGGVANIIPADDDEDVVGLLWQVTRADVARLDRYEGSAYRKVKIVGPEDIFAYTMIPSRAGLSIPSWPYFGVLFEQYVRLGFATRRLQAAADEAVKRVRR